MNENLETKNPETPELPRNVVVVERPEAIFQIAYGIHNVKQEREDVEGADAIVLETSGLGYYFTPGLAESTFEEAANFIQYSEIIKFAAEQKMPIFLLILIEV